MRKRAGTGKRQEINMVRDIYRVVAAATHQSCRFLGSWKRLCIMLGTCWYDYEGMYDIHEMGYAIYSIDPHLSIYYASCAKVGPGSPRCRGLCDCASHLAAENSTQPQMISFVSTKDRKKEHALVTLFVPSLIACFASSPGRMSLTAV